MFEIKNIKISLKVKKVSLNSVLSVLDHERVKYVFKNNYIIIKRKYVFVVFKPKDQRIHHINITGIKEISGINKSICLLKLVNIVPIFYKIDNITASYNHNCTINLIDILNKTKNLYPVKFNKEKFPGLFIKVKLGTFIIFHTGKINLVGCQNVCDIQLLFDELISILN
jgi:TATA-box binding protein (TBP) (component of TFIID and TFIIIB)